jgi:hypothetical protein
MKQVEENHNENEVKPKMPLQGSKGAKTIDAMRKMRISKESTYVRICPRKKQI